MHLTQTVDIETPELVVVSYTIAGLGSRVYAALIDLIICAVMFFGVIFGVILMARGEPEDTSVATPSTAWALALMLIMQFVILWGYYLLFEGLRDGQTPGKRMLGLRAVRDGGYSVGFSASAVRNLMRIVDLQPAFSYLVGIGSIAFTKNGKRLGDIVAGTLVVREALVRQPARAAAPLAQDARATRDGAADRRGVSPARTVERTAEDARDRSPASARDAGRGAGPACLTGRRGVERERGVASPPRDRTSGSRARRRREGCDGCERYAIVTTRSPRWIAFAARLADTQRRGLRALGESGVREFVAEYRALSVDLARLRTAARGSASDELFYLGRLVAGAHNLLYRDQRTTLSAFLRYIAIDVPTEVRRSARPIALAAAFLFIPAIVAYTAVVRDPSVAPIFIPTQMLDRADEGVKRARSGEGYIKDPQVFRPVMASQIISNNVQVTIAVFAFGITAGIGTLLMLLLNGVSLGGVFGLYASKGILSLLVAFVAPHGVLELSAVCIAGGAGLLIAAGLVLPGNHTRRRALAENSRRSMRLITASTILLIVAGSLEGLVSPIPYWPLSLKLIVSAMTLVLMIAYLRGGARPILSLPARPSEVEPANVLSL